MNEKLLKYCWNSGLTETKIQLLFGSVNKKISSFNCFCASLCQPQDTGKLNVAYFRFDINDATGDLDANRPVPFRLTPNISEFLTTIGVSGPLTASMIAVARCFAQPNFKVGTPPARLFVFINKTALFLVKVGAE